MRAHIGAEVGSATSHLRRGVEAQYGLLTAFQRDVEELVRWDLYLV